MCVADYNGLFRLLDGLEGSSDDCCTCINTVIREAERFKRHLLAQKLRQFLQLRLTKPMHSPPSVTSTSAATLHSSTAASVTVNCNHRPNAV